MFFFFNAPTVPVPILWTYFFISLTLLRPLPFITSACHALYTPPFITWALATFLANSCYFVEVSLYSEDARVPFLLPPSPQSPLFLACWDSLNVLGRCLIKCIPVTFSSDIPLFLLLLNFKASRAACTVGSVRADNRSTHIHGLHTHG